MPPLAPFANGWLARPLLSRSRAELEVWVREQGLSWVEDDSNDDESLDRNYLRRRVLPLVRERWPGSATAVARSARHVAEAQALLDALARVDVERASYGESLSVKTLRALPVDRLRNALRFWITRSGYLAPDTRRLEEIAGPLLDAREDANPFVEWRGGDNDTRRRGQSSARGGARANVRSNDVRDGVRVQRHGDLLTLQARAMIHLHATAPSELVWSWRASGNFNLPDGLGKLELERDDLGPIDLDALPNAFTIRWRRGGERLSPRAGGPRRMLKRLLQESHIPVTERARLPLLYSVTPSEEKLLAVADLLLDATVQATATTRHRGRLLWIPSGTHRR